jgi:DNA-directed RNA polymerase subunit alpha
MEKFVKYDLNFEKNLENDHYGKFTISPLEKGFGITLGNALRRVMLSSAPGASAFAIKIPGVNHEYQIIDGVKEDVTEIILNIKNLVIKIDENVYSDEELSQLSLEKWPTLKINKSQVGEVKAGDIECPAGITIINKELHIATVTTKNSKFAMDIYTTRGRGFKSFQENKDKINTVGVISIDSNFTPVIKVSYKVEEIITAKRGTNDKLEFEVSTNGSITPSDLISLAAKILSSHLEPLIAINDRIKEIEVMKEREIEEKASILAIPIEDLGISMRSYNGLKRAGIQTVEEITNMTRDQVAKVRNLGKKSVREISSKLTERGLKFKEE